MKKEKVILAAVLIFAVGFCFSWNVFSKQKKEDDDIKLELERARAYGEIQNVLSAHTYCYDAQKQDYEIEHFWSKRNDISYNSGNRGREAVKKFFIVDNGEQARKAKLKRMSELYPDEVKNVPENLGIGDMVIHLVTSPYIEVAGDCKTAVGLFYCPSLCVSINYDGEPVPTMIWDKCKVAFIKEDGQWKIWHYRQYTQFSSELDKSIFDPPKSDRSWMMAQPMEMPARDGSMPIPDMDAMNQQYSNKRVADWQPEIPQSYETWDDLPDFYEE